MPPHYLIRADEERLPFALALVESLLAHSIEEVVCSVVCEDEVSARAVGRIRMPQIRALAPADVSADESVLEIDARVFVFGELSNVLSCARSGEMTRFAPPRLAEMTDEAVSEVHAVDFSGFAMLGPDLVVPLMDTDCRLSASALTTLVVPYANALTRAAAWLASVTDKEWGLTEAIKLDSEHTFVARAISAKRLQQRSLPHRQRPLPGGWLAFESAQVRGNEEGEIRPQLAPVPAPPEPRADRPPRVTALVSTYKAQRFIRGCLDDLVAQTLFERGELEIVVVDSASPQDEQAIVREYIARFGERIRYIRSPEREGVYMAWNRAALAARGRYLTNANTDDRHRHDAFERLADALDEHPDVGLVYADSYLTKEENRSFADADHAGRFAWPAWSRDAALHGCFIGPHPMWRRAVHDKVGWFDGRYVVAGDYEMWLRIAEEFDALHLDETLGLYLDADGGVENANREICVLETLAARRLYARRLGSDVVPGKYPDTYYVPREHIGSAPAGAPKVFSVETVLACDLRCPECAIGGDRIDGRKRAVHDIATYKVIADKIRPYADYVYLHVWGEPMLNKDVFDIIAYTARFAKTNISTNGNSLTSETAERLVASGVSDIIVSIDGYSQAVYEKYRVGGDVQKALRALMWLQRARLSQRRAVNLIPQFIVFEHNEHEMEEFARFCGSIGLEPSFKPAYIALDDSRFRPSTHAAYRNRRYETLAEQRRAMRDCRDPREVFTILSDGSVVVCCHDSNAETNFGNIFEQDVMSIWNSPRYRAMRGDIIGGNAPSFCTDNCLSYQRQGHGQHLIHPDSLRRPARAQPQELSPCT